MDIANILTYLRPDEKWSLNGDSYEGLVWLDTTVKPTKKELENAQNEYTRLYNNDRAKSNRAKAYSSESDPIYFKWQRGEATQAEYLAKVEEIKLRYPYV